MQDLRLLLSLYLNYNIYKVPSKQVARKAKTIIESASFWTIKKKLLVSSHIVSREDYGFISGICK